MAQVSGAAAPPDFEAKVERVSDRELLIVRRFDAPVPPVYDAWGRAELFRQWWVPQSCGMVLRACDMDVRPGGRYRLEFGHPEWDQPFAVFGQYRDVVPGERLSWTNDESDEGPITTVTFAEHDGRAEIRLSNLFPSAVALEREMASGAPEGMRESFAQLDDFLRNSASA